MSDAYFIDWNNRTHWRVLPLPIPPEADAWAGIEIATMPDGGLWEAINWCVANMLDLYAWAGKPVPRVAVRIQLTPELSAKFWLRERPVFSVMVIAAAARSLAFQPAVFEYLRRFVLEPARQSGEILTPGLPPWRNPNLVQDQARFRKLMTQTKKTEDNLEDSGDTRFLDI